MAKQFVEYNGAKYELIGQGFAEAQTGDLFESVGNRFETEGKLYEITIDDSNGYPIRFVDNNGWSNGYHRDTGSRNLYRKVQAEEPADFVDHYVGIKREDVQVGDYIEYKPQEDLEDGTTVGRYYEVTELDSDGDPRFLDDLGDLTYAAHYEEWVAWRKVQAEEAQYVEISGDQVEAGDYVVFNEECMDVSVGKRYEIEGTRGANGLSYRDDDGDERTAWRKQRSAKFYRKQVEEPATAPAVKEPSMSAEDLERLADLVTERIIARMVARNE